MKPDKYVDYINKLFLSLKDEWSIARKEGNSCKIKELEIQLSIIFDIANDFERMNNNEKEDCGEFVKELRRKLKEEK